ncbi:hypothetical protein EV356DRAFT_565264 [Viridothelium virens]|uniref:Uncharacterized protein n=1 Tax=Viridothelium virens TaxID=1048519 RepID=A0A6A6HFE5_VIRVR|nr:hypothetical protein EV356DRAFT_565264 [Viridothelium virens]
MVKMHLISVLLLCLFSTPISSRAAPSHPPPSPSPPFTSTPAFTASLYLDARSNPVHLPNAGSLITEVITNGTVSGPLINATIQGGFAHPTIFVDQSEKGNVTVQAPVIDMYGKTEDGEDWYLHAEGSGATTGQVARIVFDVSGKKYAPLRDGFILAKITPNKQVTEVVVEGFLFSNPNA